MNKLQQNYLHLSLLLVLLFFANAVSAMVSATVPTETVYVGDSITLSISSDQNVDGMPDLSPLKNDFDVLGTGTSTSMSFVNGSSSYKKSWNITLQPKRKGTLVIPPLTVANEQTSPISITVMDIPAEVVAKLKQHVSVEAEVGVSDSYVQQQIPYIVHLYTDSSIRSGDLNPPVIADAVLEQIGDDRRYQVKHNGKAMNVIERHYVISAEKSGELLIPPTVFYGKQVDPQAQNRRSSRFDSLFDRTPFGGSFFQTDSSRPVTVYSNEITVKVKPVPGQYSGNSWLPAESVEIVDSWDEQLPEFTSGEPVIRQLSIISKGLSGSQIPLLDVTPPVNMRVYPDQDSSETRTDGKTVFGIKKQTINYIPSQQGQVIIPAIELSWWNTKTQQQEVYKVAAKTVNVLAGQNSIAPAPVAPVVEKVEATEEPAAADDGLSIPPKVFAWIALELGFVLFIAWLLIRMWKKSKTSKAFVDPEKMFDSSKLLSELEQACQNNDNHQAAKLLLELAQQQWPENAPHNLGLLAKQIEQGREQILALDKSLYSSDADSWDGDALWQQFKDGFIGDSHKAEVSFDPLPGLYPKL